MSYQNYLNLWWTSATDEQKEIRKQKYIQCKQWFKDNSIKIRKLKESFRKSQTLNNWEVGIELYNLRREFRHRHIAWSITKGKTRDQIEEPSKYNRPSELMIQNYLDEYVKELCPNEIVCTSEV